MSKITTHVLDVARGCPAAGVEISLERRDATGWAVVAEGRTDADGRLRSLTDEHPLEAGIYRLRFEVERYFSFRNVESFFPEATVAFVVRDAAQHHHVPLLLAPFSYSTYRGS